MTTQRAVEEGTQGVGALTRNEAVKAERSVLVAAAVGLGVGVVAPTLWATYPWVGGTWSVPFIVLAPTVAALAGAILARSFRRGPLLWLTVALDLVILVLVPIGFLWGVGAGGTAAAHLIVAGLVLLVGHPRRWRTARLGLLVLCLSLLGTMGFVAHVFDDTWVMTLVASLLNLTAMVVVIRRAAALSRGSAG